MTDLADKAAAACVGLLEAMTQRRAGSPTANDVMARAYIVRLREYPVEVLRVLADRWTEAPEGKWFPTVHELTALADQIAAEHAARAASNAPRITGAGGVTLQPEGATAAFVADCRNRMGDAWVAAWLGLPDPIGEHTPVPWVRFAGREIHTIAFGVARLREKVPDLLAKHGVKPVPSQAAADMAAEWAARMTREQQDAKARRKR